MKNIIIGIMFILLNTVCGCSMMPTTIDNAYNRTTVHYNEYTKDTWINGPQVSVNIGIDGGGHICLHTDGEHYQLYASTFVQLGWCFFHTAYDIDGNNLELVGIDQRIGSGITEEKFIVKLSKRYLVDHLETGLNIKIFGKRRNTVFKLSPIYIQGFLKKVDETCLTN